jgi:hypothetical protein
MTSVTATGVPGVRTRVTGSLSQVGIDADVSEAQAVSNASAFTVTCPRGSPFSVPLVGIPGTSAVVRVAVPLAPVTVTRRHATPAGAALIATEMTPTSPSPLLVWQAPKATSPSARIEVGARIVFSLSWLQRER